MNILISCGEASGDLYAGALAAELRARQPDVRLTGMGGARLRGAGADLVADYHGLSVTGLSEALSVLPRARRKLRTLVEAARTTRPDVLVAIDFPDFNMRLAGALKSLGVRVVYYVSPQLWAWRPGRMRTMKRVVDRMLVIFPFEAPLYERAGVPVEFVGHPLMDLIHVSEPRDVFLARRRLHPRAPTVALLPGSRPNEIRAILPTLIEAAGLIAARTPGAQFLIARAPGLDSSLFLDVGMPGGRAPEIVDSRTDDVLAASDVVITASGTATVQTAMHEKPMVVVYRLSPLTYRLGKPFVRVQNYAMVNLVAGERVVTELIQDAFTPEAVAAEATSLLTDVARASAMREALRRVKRALGERGASGRAADAVLREARRK